MKRPQKILETAAQKLDIPGNVMAGLPKLEMTGFSELTIEQHKGILEYTDRVIAISLGIGTIRIEGEKLSIRLMNHQFVVVSGHMRAIALVTEGANG